METIISIIVSCFLNSGYAIKNPITIPDKFYQRVAWILPKKLVTWCASRVGGYATMGKYSNTEVPEVTFMEVLKRWDESN